MLLLFFCLEFAAAQTLVKAGAFNCIYNTTNLGENIPWYINDHTLVLGPGNTWHLFGITHTEPADPQFEVNFAHAVLPSSSISPSSSLSYQPFALGSLSPETLLWAPHVIQVNNTFYMFYCGGGDDRTQYHLQLAISTDLWNWTRVETMFQGGVDGRDPMVMNLGSDYNNMWIIYWTGTNPDSVTGTVNHVTYYHTSQDLIHWNGPSGIAFDAGSDGNNYGGPTESPFVVRRGNNFYLFSGSWNGYTDTRVFLSQDPFNFGSIPLNTAIQVGEIYAHCPEVVRDSTGAWYITGGGWGLGGLFMAPLTWSDGLDSSPTSMPPPISLSSQPLHFNSNLSTSSSSLAGWVSSGGGGEIFTSTPSGLMGGSPLDDGFFISKNSFSTLLDFTYDVDFLLVTKDGNPDSSPSAYTRVGSGAALMFFVVDPSNPISGSYAANIFTDNGGGVKLFRFPYQEITHVTTPILQAVTYHLQIRSSIVSSSLVSLEVWFGEGNVTKRVIAVNVSMSSVPTSGYYSGVNVWQGAVLIQNLMKSG